MKRNLARARTYVVFLCWLVIQSAHGYVSESEDVPVGRMTAVEVVDAPQYSLSQTKAASSILASFTRFVRVPIREGAGYVTMEKLEPAPLPTAYYRDVYFGAETLLKAEENDTARTWVTKYTLPDGKILTSTVPYYKDYNGYKNCFIADRIICGTRTIRLYWYANARCEQEGSYTMTFFENGTQYEQRDFKLLAQIDPYRLPLYNQDDYPDEEMGWFPFFKPTIASQGCMLTSLSMILAHHDIKGSNGQVMTPDEFNHMLIDAGGYTYRSQIIWAALSEITGGLVNMSPALSFDNLRDNICHYGPQPVGAEGSAGLRNTHWMVATGLKDNDQFMVNDPKSARDSYYGESWAPSNSTRGIIGPELKITNLSQVSIYLHSPAELLVTDSLGRRLGIDPETGESFSEIPNSMYDLTGLADQITGEAEEPSKLLMFYEPLEGAYSLEVVGTGTGSYDMEVHAMGESLERSSMLVRDVAVSPYERHNYNFEFSGAPGEALEFVAEYLGGGQNTTVNSFLSYGSPVESTTNLPAGTAVYPVSVFYGRGINPSSFAATLNGVDVTSLFHPSPGTNERVDIEVASGRNVLKLEVRGTNNRGRESRDADRLVFLVP